MADDDWWNRVPGPYGKQSRIDEILEERDLRGAAKADWLVDRVRDVGGALGRATDAVLTGAGEGKRRARGWVDEYGRTVYVKNPGSRFEQWYRIDPETGLEERVTPAGLTPEEDKAKKGRQLHTFGNEVLFSVGDKAIPRVLGAVGLEDDPEGDESRRIQRSKDIEENYPEDYWTGLGGAVGATLPLGFAAVDKYLRGPEISRKAAQHLPRLKDAASRTALGRRLGFGAGTGMAYSGLASYGRWDESDPMGEAKFYEDLPLDLLLGAGLGTTLVAGIPAAIKHARKIPGLGVATGAGIAGSDVLPSSAGTEDRNLDEALKIHQERSWDEAADEWQRQYVNKRLPPAGYQAGGVVKMAGGGTPLKFFSVLQKAIEDSPQKKMRGEQWKSYLKPGREVKDDGVTYPLRQDELDFTELDFETSPAINRTPEEEARWQELLNTALRTPEMSREQDRLADIPRPAQIDRLPFVDYLSKRGQETLAADDLLKALSTRDLPEFKIHGGHQRGWVDEAVRDAEMEAMSEYAMELAESGWARAQHRRLSPEQRAVYEQLREKDVLSPNEARLLAELAPMSKIPDDFGSYSDKVFDAFIDDNLSALRSLGVDNTAYNKAKDWIEHARKKVLPPASKYDQYILPGPKGDYQEDTTWWKPTIGPDDADRTYLAPHQFNVDAANRRHSSPSGRLGLLSWSRATSRKTEDGTPVMVVEEIQSDLHQRGREGYRPRDHDKRVWQIRKEADELNQRIRADYVREVTDKYDAWVRQNPPPRGSNSTYDKHEEWSLQSHRMVSDLQDAYNANPVNQQLNARFGELREQLDNLDALSAQPYAAPYSKTYAELELRKQLMHAIDEGMDLVAVTTGRQQADRWHQALTEHIDEILWSGNLRGNEIRYNIRPQKGGQRVPVGEDRTDNLTEAELKNLVGVDVAKKIVERAHEMKNNSTGDPYNLIMAGKISGTDITIGAQGMRHFYDRVVPEAMKKLAKQYGMEVTKIKLPQAISADKTFDSFFGHDPELGPRERVNWSNPDMAEAWAYEMLSRAGQRNPMMLSPDPRKISLDDWLGLDPHSETYDWPEQVIDLFHSHGTDLWKAVWHASNSPADSPEYRRGIEALREFLNEAENIAAELSASSGGEMTALKITPEAKQKILKRGMPYFAVPAAGAAAVATPPEEEQGFAGGGIVRRLADRLAGRTKTLEKEMPHLDLPPLEPEPTHNLPAVVERGSPPSVVDELKADVMEGLPELPVPEASRRGFLGIMRKGAAAATMGPRASALAEKLAPPAKPEATPEQIYDAVRDQLSRELRPSFKADMEAVGMPGRWATTYADYLKGGWYKDADTWGEYAAKRGDPPPDPEALKRITGRGVVDTMRQKVEAKIGRKLSDDEWKQHVSDAVLHGGVDEDPIVTMVRDRWFIPGTLNEKEMAAFRSWLVRNKHPMPPSTLAEQVVEGSPDKQRYRKNLAPGEFIDPVARYLSYHGNISPDKAKRWLERHPTMAEKIESDLYRAWQDLESHEEYQRNNPDWEPMTDRDERRVLKDLGFRRGGKVDFDPEGDGYDYDEADKGGLSPGEDLHWPSRRPLSQEEAETLGLPADSGLMLKGRKHPTWGKAVEADEELGYRLIQKNGRWYTVKETGP